ncbi:cystatin-B-like [Pristis pectinata]|uniref:cystatin-B-like n=1 Tax=Pristis pectinata TaxID=685728 RepID=UPI00223D33D3|nr:cystatin-B-like [Pristis pectinata]
MSAKGICCGGISQAKDVTPEVQQIVDSVKSEIEEKAEKTFDVFVVKVYKSQVVAGTNHYFKIHVGGNDYLHAKVFEQLPCHGGKKMLSGIQSNKSEDEELIYF